MIAIETPAFYARMLIALTAIALAIALTVAVHLNAAQRAPAQRAPNASKPNAATSIALIYDGTRSITLLYDGTTSRWQLQPAPSAAARSITNSAVVACEVGRLVVAVSQDGTAMCAAETWSTGPTAPTGAATSGTATINTNPNITLVRLVRP